VDFVFDKANILPQRRTEALYQENASLRQQIESSRSPRGQLDDHSGQNHAPVVGTMPNHDAAIVPPSSSTMRDVDPGTTPPSSAPTQVEESDQRMSTTWDPSFNQDTQLAIANDSTTQPRALAGIRVEAEEIDELFRLYLHFAQYYTLVVLWLRYYPGITCTILRTCPILIRIHPQMAIMISHPCCSGPLLEWLHEDLPQIPLFLALLQNQLFTWLRLSSTLLRL
jgi:hypothetical protein